MLLTSFILHTYISHSGWFTGRDGEAHCGIDVEELLGGYKHRVGDVRKATNPWVGNWDTY